MLVGDNFRFGHRQAGDVAALAELGRELGFETEIVPAVTLPRTHGEQQRDSRADSRRDACRWPRACCERPYALDGEVVSGRGVGSRADRAHAEPGHRRRSDSGVAAFTSRARATSIGGAPVELHHQHRLPAHVRRERPALHRDFSARSAGRRDAAPHPRGVPLAAFATSASSRAPRR